MFENGEATDVVTKSHKGSSTEANKSADKAVCLDVARRGVDGHALATIEMADG